jgi:hypothetical protein
LDHHLDRDGIVVGELDHARLGFLGVTITASGEEWGSRTDDSFVDRVAIFATFDCEIRVLSLFKEAAHGQDCAQMIEKENVRTMTSTLRARR